MKSPRFNIRANSLRTIFSASNIKRIWKEKVRVSMRQQFVSDGIENFDFHLSIDLEAKKLSNLILEGDYVPSRAYRVLVEKSKGLCRQLVIPSIRDAIVLQCLSDALYAEIQGNAPTKKSFFEPQDHRFSTARSKYGTFASWLNFQRELFNFSKSRNYVIITDVANYYDTISYAQLRNVIASLTEAEECILDMLIYVLSDLLWQPDYTPRVEVGLPQINLDAPRLLAHCFLYELDLYLASKLNVDFVRFMDDIDIGVDTIVEAKSILQSVDLVLQTRHIRLNSGKTAILTRDEALNHFRVFENARLDTIQRRVDRRISKGLNLDRERKLVELRIRNGVRGKFFDSGNGEKTLKRWITLATRTSGRISPSTLERLLRSRPAIRENVLAYIRSKPLTMSTARCVSSAIDSGWLIDDASAIDIANYITETRIERRDGQHIFLKKIINSADATTFYGFYCKIWLQSKYSLPEEVLDTITTNRTTWVQHERLGRLVGALTPLFMRSSLERAFQRQLFTSLNQGVRETYIFQSRLAREPQVFRSMFAALANPNPSRGTGITHAKFLCLLSALQNTSEPKTRRDTLIKRNSLAFSDVYYRATSKRLRII